MKYKVIFVQGDNHVTLVVGLTDVQACQYAINLHQSSNLAHRIYVLHDSDVYGDDSSILTFVKE